MASTPELTARTGAGAWDTIWKWTWFTKEQWQGDFRKRQEGTRRALASLLAKLGVNSILDCSCGLGWKTILLAEMGYDAEGSDGCGLAVRKASQLAREEGLDIRFFRARWEKLGQICGRKYDCIYNDAFAWITRRGALLASARGICAALKRGGKFVFQGAHQWSGRDDRDRIIRQRFQQDGPFEALPLHEKNGIRLTTIVTRHKRPDGVLGNRIHVIEDHGAVRVEIASVLDACIWSWTDYTETLRQAGFRRLYSVKAKGVGRRPYILNVAEK
jgi:SAM-dependent methyltransferase